jgi:Ca2+-binding EF-hand superfamily protein
MSRVQFLLALFLLCGTNLSAQQPPATQRERSPQTAPAFPAREAMGALFRFADRNRDGQLSAAEIAPFAKRLPQLRFDEADTDKNALLSQQELRSFAESAFRGIDPRAMFRTADKNGDQSLTKAEFKAAYPNLPEQVFTKLDRNDDGKIDRTDGPPSPDGFGLEPETQSESGRFLGALLRKADSNRDSKVTYEELVQQRPGFPRDTFDATDTNRDGFLSKEDMSSIDRVGERP